MVKSAKSLAWMLLIVTAAALIFGSYRLAWHRANIDNKALKTQIARLKNDFTNSTYIKLKPWGVEFPLADNNNQLIYVIDKTALYFDSEGLELMALNKDSKSTCLPGSASLGALTQSTDPVNGNPSVDSDGMVAHVGSYYYNFFHPSETCSSDKTVIDEQRKQTTDLITGLKQMRLTE